MRDALCQEGRGAGRARGGEGGSRRTSERKSYMKRVRARCHRPPLERSCSEAVRRTAFEHRPRHIPALAAEAQTPALFQLQQASPLPATAPQPDRAQPGEDSTRRRPCAKPQRPPAAPLSRRVRGLSVVGKEAVGRAGRRPAEIAGSLRAGRTPGSVGRRLVRYS